jgi:nitrogen PTS system EIIA component
MRITDVILPRNILVGLKSRNKVELFDEIVDFLAEKENLPDRDSVKKNVWAREKMLSTGIMPRIAMPHAQIKNLNKTVGMIGLSREGIEYETQDGKPVHIVLFFVDDEKDSIGHLQTLRNAAQLTSNPRFYSRIIQCMTPLEVYQAVKYFEELEDV